MVGVEEEVQLAEVAGRTVNLSCEAHGHPPPRISWSIIGSQVSELASSLISTGSWCNSGYCSLEALMAYSQLSLFLITLFIIIYTHTRLAERSILVLLPSLHGYCININS